MSDDFDTTLQVHWYGFIMGIFFVLTLFCWGSLTIILKWTPYERNWDVTNTTLFDYAQEGRPHSNNTQHLHSGVEQRTKDGFEDDILGDDDDDA